MKPEDGYYLIDGACSQNLSQKTVGTNSSELLLTIIIGGGGGGGGCGGGGGGG